MRKYDWQRIAVIGYEEEIHSTSISHQTPNTNIFDDDDDDVY
jgi:hypothetical protein